MARKSNKTAHVLNLLSGQDTNEEPEKEPEKPKETKPSKKAETAKADTESEPEPAPAKPQTAPPEVPSNISIVNNGAQEDDPVAKRIHEELLKELEMEEAPVAASSPEPPVTEAAPSQTSAAPVAEEPKAEAPAAPIAETPKAKAPAAPVEEAPKAEALAIPAEEAPKAEVPAVPAAEDAKAEVPAQTPAPKEEVKEEIVELSPEPPAEPEPDYVMLNVMQRVVEDKIIYFMKQFEVCTCDRCKADTIALTLSGLPSKYRIVDKHAVDPLVSYYTSRLISQVTVEALKACTQVKDNPRH